VLVLLIFENLFSMLPDRNQNECQILNIIINRYTNLHGLQLINLVFAQSQTLEHRVWLPNGTERTFDPRSQPYLSTLESNLVQTITGMCYTNAWECGV
jgi:hypothetical protein